ncbi:MAG: endonuclease/exonuclease/phosphatase family protein [Deltaproteobacteria bacterium]|nr:endonuclease/exonuclease/phosphatase family protein [Deltaproteobacteria bacterium]
MNRWLRRILWTGLVLAGIALAAAGWCLITEWRPDTQMDMPIYHAARAAAQPANRLRLLTWNIGYAGLGKTADFFMDGGARVNPPREEVEANLANVSAFLARQSGADVLLLQEVDRDSARSFGIDQAAHLAAALPDHAYSFAPNFKVAFVPYPLTEPIGRVYSGLLGFSRQRIDRAVRFQLPGSYAWPVRVFHLKRCIQEIRLRAPDGRDWVVLHLHLSAFDSGGTLRRQQMDFLRRRMLQLYADGHHVLAGGDWNQAFPGLDAASFPHRAHVPDWFQRVPEGWTPEGWTWAFDRETPSLRATNRPYMPGESFVTSVDGFLLGPDVELVRVETEDLHFGPSDHHPVIVEVALRAAPP